MDHEFQFLPSPRRKIKISKLRSRSFSFAPFADLKACTAQKIFSHSWMACPHVAWTRKKSTRKHRSHQGIQGIQGIQVHLPDPTTRKLLPPRRSQKFGAWQPKCSGRGPQTETLSLTAILFWSILLNNFGGHKNHPFPFRIWVPISWLENITRPPRTNTKVTNDYSIQVCSEHEKEVSFFSLDCDEPPNSPTWAQCSKVSAQVISDLKMYENVWKICVFWQGIESFVFICPVFEIVRMLHCYMFKSFWASFSNPTPRHLAGRHWNEAPTKNITCPYPTMSYHLTWFLDLTSISIAKMP